MLYRDKRVAEALRSEIAKIITTELADPNLGFVTVVGVRLAKDLKKATVYVTVIGDEPKQKLTIDHLERARKGFIKRPARGPDCPALHAGHSLPSSTICSLRKNGSRRSYRNCTGKKRRRRMTNDECRMTNDTGRRQPDCSSSLANRHYPCVGFLNVNKPSGITSYDVIRRLKPVFDTRHLGHAGTLDPLATGVPVGPGERSDQGRGLSSDAGQGITLPKSGSASAPTPTT